MEILHGCLQSYVYVSSDGDAQKIKPHLIQIRTSRTPPTQPTTPPFPSRTLLLLWWALDFATTTPAPLLPTSFTQIPPMKVIAIARTDDKRETHWVLRLYLRQMWHLVIFSGLFGEHKRLPAKSTPLFGTMELDQGEANVCI